MSTHDLGSTNTWWMSTFKRCPHLKPQFRSDQHRGRLNNSLQRYTNITLYGNILAKVILRWRHYPAIIQMSTRYHNMNLLRRGRRSFEGRGHTHNKATERQNKEGLKMWYWKVLEMQPPAKETQCTRCCTRKDGFSPGVPTQWDPVLGILVSRTETECITDILNHLVYGSLLHNEN